jgi:hypothetical protein
MTGLPRTRLMGKVRCHSSEAPMWAQPRARNSRRTGDSPYGKGRPVSAPCAINRSMGCASGGLLSTFGPWNSEVQTN